MKRFAAILLLLSNSAAAQTSDSATGSFIIGSAANTITFRPQSYTMSAKSFEAPNTLTVAKSKDCLIVILEDNAEKIVLGCRKEFK